MHILFIYLHLNYLYISIYLVLFTLFFCQILYQKFVKFFVSVFFNDMMSLRAVLPPANRCIADRGFEYRYICPFQGTRERAVILDNLIQIF